MTSASREKIEKRAYELYLKRGGAHGYDVADWLKAEKEILGNGQSAAPAGASRPAAKTRAGAATGEPKPQPAARSRTPKKGA